MSLYQDFQLGTPGSEFQHLIYLFIIYSFILSNCLHWFQARNLDMVGVVP